MPEWLVKALSQMYSESSQQQSLNEPPSSLPEELQLPPTHPSMDEADWMALADIYQKILAVVIGYRTSAISGGFDSNMADHMAAQLHTVILQRLFTS